MGDALPLTIAVVTLTVATIGTFFAWRNYRLALNSEQPEVVFDPLDHGLYSPDQVMFLYFKLETRNSNLGWRVHRVEVIEAIPPECLRHGETNQNEWRNFDDFDHPIEHGQYGGLEVRPNCNELTVRFLCRRPRNRWWWKGLTQEKKWVGPIPLSWQLQPRQMGRLVWQDVGSVINNGKAEMDRTWN